MLRNDMVTSNDFIFNIFYQHTLSRVSKNGALVFGRDVVSDMFLQETSEMASTFLDMWSKQQVEVVPFLYSENQQS